MLAEVAAVNPGLVSTLNVLEGHLKNGPLPPAPALRGYGEYLVRLGSAVVSYADECMRGDSREHNAGGRPRQL
ncbi:hypothetical protein [Thermocrispum sp.]|jgi:hypothetical protein|uniref:hypothetical protein n=1 Tax=Thermocrispum sp. TaxID=2060768 RepID=UPI00257DDF14|nr:hypothetical protein [Thermocrispum sp.]